MLSSYAHTNACKAIASGSVTSKSLRPPFKDSDRLRMRELLRKDITKHVLAHTKVRQQYATQLHNQAETMRGQAAVTATATAQQAPEGGESAVRQQAVGREVTAGGQGAPVVAATADGPTPDVPQQQVIGAEARAQQLEDCMLASRHIIEVEESMNTVCRRAVGSKVKSGKGTKKARNHRWKARGLSPLLPAIRRTGPGGAGVNKPYRLIKKKQHAGQGWHMQISY